MKQLLLDIQAPAKPSFDNFVIGRNAEAIASLQAALSGSAAHRFIYLWGEAGSGKSHLIAASKAQDNQNLLCVDDVDSLNDDEQIALFDLYNQMRAGEGMLIATGKAAPTQMNLRDDLATRLAWGLVYQLHPLSDQEKALALKSHAQQRGMKLPDEVLDYCLRHLKRDLPNLLSTINALDEWSLSSKRQVTLPLLKQLLNLGSG